MNSRLDRHYFDWLYSLVCSVKQDGAYRELFRQLFTKEFVWFIPNDDNRAEDGKDLRYEFLEANGYEPEDNPDWIDLGCSMLELLIGLSRRLEFETDEDYRKWFWRLLENLGLSKCTDQARCRRDEVEELLDRVIWRTYDYNGHGGLFPLRRADRDQREVEIWYQLSAYLLERD